MVMSEQKKVFTPEPFATIVERLEAGGALLPDSPENLLEVVGILKSYGEVLNAYQRNLLYIADRQFLVFFPFFKYFNGEVTLNKLLDHWAHERINYEFAEYCMKAMLWHGAPKLDAYLDSPEFSERAERAIKARLKGNPAAQLLHRCFPDFLPEWVRQQCYYSVLGQFWRVMYALFLTLWERYERGEIRAIPDVVQHILENMGAAANDLLTYSVKIRGEEYVIIPASADLRFLMDAAVPYVEAVFFRSAPFMGTVSYNAQAGQIPFEQADFQYGALYADPLPIGGAGIPPTLLMQDMKQHLPEILRHEYLGSLRGEEDMRVQICVSFQKSMFCVTTAAIQALAPYPLTTTRPEQRQANRAYLDGWMKRLATSRLAAVNPV
ncbi:CO2 hydration protein [Gloeobacter kilaueensis]|uniref:CO2 hydration protein n=1 Tax=Gloeobacter kilaueensis (strain ATCC BAA-2537 / CCAP 1431/1 / ULC 316 / JS1) TaxID=1183438 RepID=U5QNX3_GLOK1|nr:CO2 hydration protein [Gloeobacter kilaueensis]AGY60593.1 CO2 hydration protein [Gloeobacter kilaueensis JS1]